MWRPMPVPHTLDGSVSERDIYHHESIAKGGAGLIIVGATSPNHLTNRSTVTNLAADDDTYIPGSGPAGIRHASLRLRVAPSNSRTQAVKPRFPARESLPPTTRRSTSRGPRAIPSCMPTRMSASKTVHVLSTDEVIEIVEEFSEAAWRVDAGRLRCGRAARCPRLPHLPVHEPLPQPPHRPLRREL